eukprot:gnl/MRDRNA2_/MRDRNA2_223316_c0_seq1.p1 gnl/MRDRNA2_/MRDRNA2_223316_c0~~gnl/MRDRNA2_/MRDRNA2_223316_c0_seq1.p1  ORF type:complete len:251 (-),score=39.56 gnl/MRDRNA2_/MRDRNA2_223316_c0_seq1:167-865(-)
MRPEGAASVIKEAMESVGAQIHHVVAHSGVQWWDKPEEELTSVASRMAYVSAIKSMEPEEFAKQAVLLPKLQYAAAQHLLPHMADVPGASYTFVTAGPREQRSIVAQVNAHAVWGLAAALRSQYRGSPVRVAELRMNLKVGRPAHERVQDRRQQPLSVEIGEICAGIALNHDQVSTGLCSLDSIQDVMELKRRFPCPDIVHSLPKPKNWRPQYVRHTSLQVPITTQSSVDVS